MPLAFLLTILGGYVAAAERTVHERRRAPDDAGASTLELVIIILGLIAVAAALVAVVTVAVTSRLDQIN